MSDKKTRSALKTLITNNFPSATGAISAADLREFANALVESARLLLEPDEAAYVVINMSTTTPPGSPSDGDTYVVASGATGDWSGQDDAIAIYDSQESPAAWNFITPTDQISVRNQADETTYVWDAGASPAAWAAESGITKATASNIRSGAADTYVTSDGVESAAEEVTLTDAATVAVDWSAFINGAVTLAGNRTLGNPTNGEPGTWRFIRVIQDGTGSRTLSFAANYKFAGGTAPTLTTTASAVDVLSIYCVGTSNFYVFSALDFS